MTLGDMTLADNVRPHDRFAHLVKLAARALARALQMRLAEHAVSYGHWTFLRILWEAEGLTQRELGARAGVTAPTVYHHFGDKAALVTRVIDECFGEFDRATAAAGATTPTSTTSSMPSSARGGEAPAWWSTSARACRPRCASWPP